MNRNITILYPGLDNQALALSYPRTKEAIDYITADPEAMTAKWAEERKKGVGASAVCALMGCGYHDKSKYQLYLECIGSAAPQRLTPAMQFGHDYEPFVARDFAKDTGASIDYGSAVDFLVINNDKPYLRVSPDRFIWERGTAPENRTLENAVILECKTCSKAFAKGDDGVCLNEELPDEWYCQVQYQMGVFGVDHCYLAWFNKYGHDWSDTRGYFRIAFNPNFYASVERAIDSFWNEHVIPHIAPAPETAEDVQMMYPRENRGAVVHAGDCERNAIKRLIEVNGELEELKKAKADLENTLKVALADNEGMVGDDDKLWLTYKAAKDSPKFEKDIFREENPDLYERYVHMVPGTRRFCIKIDYEQL